MFDYRGRTVTGSCLYRIPFKWFPSLRADRKFSFEDNLPKSRQILSPLNLRYRLQTAVVAGVTCFTFVAWIPPALSQEFGGQEFRGEETELEQKRQIQCHFNGGVGDSVEVSGVSGDVDSINLASTKLECFDGQIVTIPNNKVWGGHITNKETDIRGAILPIRVTLNESTVKVEEIIMEIAKSNELILEKPKPTTSVTEYGEDYVELGLSFHAKKGDYWTVRGNLMRNIKDGLKQKGIFLDSDNDNSDNDNGSQPVADGSVSKQPIAS